MAWGSACCGLTTTSSGRSHPPQHARRARQTSLRAPRYAGVIVAPLMWGVRCHEEPGCHRHRARAPVLRVQFCLSSGASEWRGSAPNRPYRCGDNQLRPPAGQCPLHSTSAVPGSAPLRVDAIIGFLRWRVGDTRNRSLHLRAWQVGYDCGAKRRRSTNPRTVARRSQSAGMPTWHLTTRCRRTKPSWHAICGRTWRASSPLPLSASVRPHRPTFLALPKNRSVADARHHGSPSLRSRVSNEIEVPACLKSGPS